MSTEDTTVTVGDTATTAASIYVDHPAISIYGPIDLNPNPTETPLHTSDYIDSDDEDTFNSVLDRIANQNHEQPQSSHSSPTSKSFIDSLPIVKLAGSLLKLCSRSCSICKDDFAVNEDVNQLPCNHVFHQDCIVPWLNRSNSCPLCRYKLPVDPRPRLRQRRQRPLMRYVVRLGNAYMEGWGEDYDSGFDDALLRSGYQVIRLPWSLPLTSSSSTRMGQAATAGPANSEDTVSSPEVHVDGAASGLATGGVNEMLDEDGDTVMRDASED